MNICSFVFLFDILLNILDKLSFVLRCNMIKKIFLYVVIFVFMFFGFGCFDGEEVDLSVDMSPRLISAQNFSSASEVAEKVKGAVVGILANSVLGSAVGSGVAISDGGYILTNHHVIEGANQIVLYYADLSSGKGEIVWSDSSFDLAIIKSQKNMPYLECGTSESLRVGDSVLAIGTPLTLQFKHTVTMGIISALNRTLEVGGVSASYLQNLIQHDASINPGNSGGPLITLDCKVVGINTLKAEEGEGIGFAIPIQVGSAITQRILTDSEYVTPYVGIFGFDASVAAYYGETSATSGVYVTVVDVEGPAHFAGIEEGDVILSVEGKKIKSVLDLKVALFGFEKGDKITLEVLKNGEIKKIELSTKERII